MAIKPNLEEICTFLKPSKIECGIYVGSLPISFCVGFAAWAITKNPFYTSVAALSPQVMEYVVFRAAELIVRKRCPSLYLQIKGIGWRDRAYESEKDYEK